MDNHGVEEKHPVDLFERKSVRVTLLVVIPAVIFVLICAGIRVSTYGINHTILIFGQKELVSGWPAAIRITLISDDGGFFLPSRLTGHLVRGDERHLLFDGAASDQGYALARNFRVPNIAPGPAELEMKINFADKRRIVRTNVKVVDEPPPEDLVVPSDTSLDTRPSEVIKDDKLVQVFTEDRGAPTGLTSVIFLRGQEQQGQKRQGSPVATQLHVELPGGTGKEPEKKELGTDLLGLLALPARPLELSFPIKVSGSRRPLADGEREESKDAGVEIKESDAYLFPRVVYAGVSASVHNPILESGIPLRIAVHQVSSSGPVYADLFHEGRWVQAVSSWFGGKSAGFEIRPEVTGLIRVQITTSTLAPGRNVAVRHFYVLDDVENLNSGLRAILKTLESKELDRDWARAASTMPLEQGAGYDRRLAGAFALSRLYEGHQIIPRLIGSRQEDDAELNAFKAEFQGMITLAIIFLGLGVASIIILIAVQAQRRHQRITMMILSEGKENEQLDHFHTDMGERHARAARRQLIIQGVILFVIILGAFMSIALLVDTMTWQVR